MLGKKRSHRLSSALALCAFAAALSGACKSSEPRTQVMLVIDAEEQVRVRATRLEVTFESRSELNHSDGVPYTETFQTAEGSSPYWPFSIALLPRNGDARRSYHITATLYEGADAIAVLRAHSGFVPQRTLELHLMFTADCLDKKSLDCSDQETCLHGDCLSAFVDAESLAELGGSAPATAAAGGIQTGSPQVRTGSQTEADGGSAGSGGAGGMSSPDTQSDAGADSGTSPAMSAGNCGDGQVNDGEECDTAIAQDQPGACPTACAPVTCATVQLEGSGCQTRCMTYMIVSATPDDGCCPTGADASSDNDCAASCGNGVIETGERCDPIADCPTEGTSCSGASACLVATVAGDAASCTAECVMRPITECISGDGCCGSSNCTHDTDSDCSASCGNGVLDMSAGELCEPSSPDHPCPAGCDDGNACTEDYPTGSAANCNAACTHVAITRPRNDDGCCPENANNNNDNDCAAVCGNHVRERGEYCDGPLCPTQVSQCNDLNACTREAITGTECQAHCTYNLINVAMHDDGCCPLGANANNDHDCPAICPNGTREPGELCDGNCPTNARACDDGNACTSDEVSGTNCQRVCVNRPLSASGARTDGCCPSSANGATDADCARCGNNVTEVGETCDPCPTSCAPPNACTRSELTGTGCNAQCVATPITAPVNGDGCCPSGATMSNDNDCAPDPAVCGNNQREGDELCDPCPTACPKPNACTNAALEGSGCNAKCVERPITSPIDNDQCCLPGQNSSTDNDCLNPPPPVCGNNRREGEELCDPCPTSCPKPNACTNAALEGSGCNAKCVERPITSPIDNDDCCLAGHDSDTDNDCPPPQPVCGNGRTEPGEDCDGNCPSCDDANPCTTDMSIPIPDACHPMCRYSDVPPRLSGPDGCCPAGQDSSTDSDCPGP